MKKLITVTFLFLFCLFANAEKIKFMNQPLGCKYSVMKQHLISKGFKFSHKTDENSYVFTGTFGRDKVGLTIFITPKSKLVETVVVKYLAYCTNNYYDKNIEYKLNDLREGFQKKYGLPNYEKDDWICWDFDDSFISIAIDSSDEYYKKALCIYYYDGKTSKIGDSEEISDY